MDLLDAVLLVLVAGGLYSGWRRGLTWVGLSFAGLVLGVILGSTVAGPLARRLSSHNPGNQALIATGCFLAVVAVVQGLGTSVGYRVRVAALRTRLREVDSAGGSALAAVGVLVGAWFFGYTFADSPFSRLDQQIQNSAIIQRLESALPRPAFLGALRTLLHDPNFGIPFVGVNGGGDLGPVPLPSSIDTPGIRLATSSTVKVLSEGCGLDAGSGWPLNADEIVTNAHVVAGGQRVTIEMPSGDTLDATVVLFDPRVDVAVLRVPHHGLTPLALGGDPARGTTGAVIGYPRGGREQEVPAAVRGIIDADGQDIYGNQTVPRRIEVLDATVIPGNSGGPMVDRDGVVRGLVFAASTSDASEGYALAASQIAPDLQAAAGRTAAVSTQDCTT